MGNPNAEMLAWNGADSMERKSDPKKELKDLQNSVDLLKTEIISRKMEYGIPYPTIFNDKNSRFEAGKRTAVVDGERKPFLMRYELNNKGKYKLAAMYEPLSRDQIGKVDPYVVERNALEMANKINLWLRGKWEKEQALKKRIAAGDITLKEGEFTDVHPNPNTPMDQGFYTEDRIQAELEGQLRGNALDYKEMQAKKAKRFKKFGQEAAEFAVKATEAIDKAVNE